MTDGVFKLLEPSAAIRIEYIFIHGLQLFEYHDAFWKTWTCKKESNPSVCWPIDWIKQDIEGARVWSLSYNSVAWKSSTTGVDTHLAAETLIQEVVEFAGIGQRGCPVVFVCHSLGGIMAKEMVTLAFNKFGMKMKYRMFLNNIKAFLFY